MDYATEPLLVSSATTHHIHLGVIVNEIGMEPLISKLLEEIISPLAGMCFPYEPVVAVLDHHHSFVVEYSARRGEITIDSNNTLV